MMAGGPALHDKLWDAHRLCDEPDGRSLIYIDRHLVQEVSSPLPMPDISTDAILPARFLLLMSCKGLSENAFFDLRKEPDCPINLPEYAEARNSGSGRAENRRSER